MADVHSQYKETQILTASPGKLLLMLYDGAISAIEGSVDLIKNKTQYDVVNKNLLKAQEILGELLASLDFEVGGEFAKNMQSLYAYMMKRLMEANFQKTIEPLDEVLGYMKELRESWAVASQKVGNQGQRGNSESTGNLNISG